MCGVTIREEQRGLDVLLKAEPILLVHIFSARYLSVNVPFL